MDEPRDDQTAEDLDDELDVNLRPPAIVAARAVVVSAVCRRAHLELAPEDLSGDDPEGERFDLAAWIVEEGLDPALTDAEQRLLKTRLGKLPRAEVLAASWQVEGLAALAWALGLLDESPGFEAPADPAALLSLIPAPWASTRPLRASAALRSEAEIARERERAELWHWRSGTVETIRGTSDAKDLSSLIREVAEEAHAAGLLDPPIGHDFPVRGRAFRDVPADARETLAVLAAERLRALNWLCGFGDDWDHVPLDV